MNDFDYAIEIDSDVLTQDVDDYDLYGERIEENNNDDFGNDLILQ